MKESESGFSRSRARAAGTLLWLTGWSMPDSAFDKLRLLLPDFCHVSVDYGAADTPEGMLLRAETAAAELKKTEPDGSSLLIAGWSLGGLLALRLAARGLADGLALFGATAQFTRAGEEKDRGWADVYVRRMISALASDRPSVETAFRKLVLTEDEWRRSGVGDSLSAADCWTTPALIAGLRILRTESALPLLPDIECPVLLVHGTEDRVCPYGAALELEAGLPAAKLLSFPGSGHAPFLGKEALVADELRSWWHER